MTKISIIMPLYNAAKYLEESLNSVLKQTLSDFELICINDASDDETRDILQKFSGKDSRIKVLQNEERSGAAFSRNKGIKEARGKYLSFLDGDDIFEEEMLEAAYEAAEKNVADIEMFEYKHVPTELVYHKLRISHGEEYIERYCKRTFSLRENLPHEILICSLSPCNKIYKRELIVSNNLEFQTLPCANDVYFVTMSFMLAERINVLDDSRVMIYVRDHSEPSRISYSRDPKYTYLAMEKVITELRDRGMLGEFYQHFYCKAFYEMKYAIERTKEENKAKAFCEFMQEEGTENLRTLGSEYYNSLDEFIKQKFQLFEDKSFETGWYRNENPLKIYLYENTNLLKDMFDDYKKRKMTIGIWGAGENGSILLEFCRCHNLDVDIVVDKSKEKQGRNISGYLVESLEENYDRMQVVIISSQFIYQDVKKELDQKNRNIEVIDLNQILKIY